MRAACGRPAARSRQLQFGVARVSCPAPSACVLMRVLVRRPRHAPTGPHTEGLRLLDAIESNMRKEYTCEGIYQVRACVRVCVCAHGAMGWLAADS